MPRIPYADPSRVSPSARAAIERTPSNVIRMLAVASPAVFDGFSAFSGAFMNGSPLPPKLREVAILRVGYLSDAAYETFQHEAAARFVGLSDEQIAAIRAGDPKAPVFDEAEAAVLEFVDDLVNNVRAGDRTLAAVRRHLSDTQVVDLILVSGTYMMVSRLLETTGVEIDEHPIDWNTLAAEG